MERRELRQNGFRFYLRPCAEGDGEAIFLAADESRKRVARWMDWLMPSYRMEDSIDWARNCGVHWEQGLSHEYVIVDSEDGTVAGCAGLNRINHKDLVCNLGYWVRESKTRCGAATQATRLLRACGLATLGMRRIEIVVADGNDISRRVAEKAGAVYEGLQKMRLRIREHSHDAHMYALLADGQAGPQEAQTPAPRPGKGEAA